MSRSYKKNPWSTDHSCRSTKNNKRISNRIIRSKIKNSSELPSLNHHKKITESWNICDYKSRLSKQEAIDWYLTEGYKKSHKVYESLDTWLNFWAKCYRRK